MSRLAPPMSDADATPTGAPVARPHDLLTLHGDERVDDWYWLRERDDPDGASRTSKPRTRTPDAVLAPTARAARAHLRRDPRPRPGDRRVGAGSGRGVGVLLAHRRRPAVRDPLPATARRSADEQVRARRERARGGPRLLLARRVRGLARSPRARVRDRPRRRRALHAPVPRPRRPAPTSPTSSTTSRTGSRGPTTVARASTFAPTTRCARTRCGVTCSGRPSPTTCSCTKKTTSASSSTSSARARGRFVLIEASSKMTSEVWFVPTRCAASARRR